MKVEARLNEILNIAEPMLLSVGIRELKLNDVIAQCSVSRATFYALIPTKETLIAYLALRGFDKMLALAERAKQVEGKAKVKFLGIYVSYLFFLKLYPALQQCIHEANGYSSRSVIGEAFTHMLDQKMHQVVTYVQWCIELAIFDRDIKIPERLTPFDLAFYMWSGYYGVVSMSKSAEFNAIDAAKKYKYYVRQILDALPWYPLSTEVDFDMMTEKIVAEVFLEEYKLIGGANFNY